MEILTIARILSGLALVAPTVHAQTVPELPIRQVLQPSSEDVAGLRIVDFGEKIDADANTLAVGLGDGAGAGAVAIFTRDSAGVWARTATLMPEDSTALDQFGVGVAIDGDTVIAANGRHEIYVFERNDGSWGQRQKLSFEGKAIIANLDLAHGVAAIASGDIGRNVAETLILRRKGSGLFERQATLRPSGADVPFPFGHVPTFNESGNTLVIGVPHEAARQGAAYIFRRHGSRWVEQQRLTAADAQPSDEFGSSIAFDGRFLVVGAPATVRADIVGNGTAYVFVPNGNSWHEQYELQPTPEEWPAGVGALGSQVELTRDSIAASAPFGGIPVVFAYERDRQDELLKAVATDATAFQGAGLASTGTTLFAGARQRQGELGGHINVYDTSDVSTP